MVNKCDVVILGAGIAGLTAARNLAKAGAKVALVEARDRVGGRIFTHHDRSLPVPIELGAEFIHGRPPALWEAIDAAGLETWELEGSACCYENGSLGECAFDNRLNVIESLKDYRGADISFKDYLERQNIGVESAWASSYVEGFNAADQTVIGVLSLAKQQEAEDNIEGSTIFRIKAGYDELPQFLLNGFLAAGGVLYKNAEAREIRWRKGEVAVTCTGAVGASSDVVAARAAVITIPLGVLMANSIRFDPHPDAAFFHLRRLAVGNARRVTLVFDDCVWSRKCSSQDQEREGFSFLFSLDDRPSTWWTTSPLLSPVITGWMGGPKAEDKRFDDESFLTEQCVATIGKLLSFDARSRLRRGYTHNWRQDPYACGAYSYIPAGAMDAPQHVAQPVANTLFFAGEHTDLTGNWGTVHGAQSSGIRVARDVAGSF